MNGYTRTVEIWGAGVVGLVCGYVLAKRGFAVKIFEKRQHENPQSCSWWAGGMLAPWCESELAEQAVMELGLRSMEFWRTFPLKPTWNGTLVVASARDVPDLKRFKNRTENWREVSLHDLQDLEPDLAGRFMQGLFYAQEGHIDPRQALQILQNELLQMGAKFEFGAKMEEVAPMQASDFRVDARGLGAKQALPELRGVKGEMLILHAPEVTLSRPVRLLHPRIPLYVVPRENQHFMIGATMIEADEGRYASARSVLELLSAAHVLHSGFSEAEIVEIGVDIRPTFADNVPKIIQKGKTFHVNGMYRHGFLAAPALAEDLASMLEQQ